MILHQVLRGRCWFFVLVLTLSVCSQSQGKPGKREERMYSDTSVTTAPFSYLIFHQLNDSWWTGQGKEPERERPGALAHCVPEDPQPRPVQLGECLESGRRQMKSRTPSILVSRDVRRGVLVVLQAFFLPARRRRLVAIGVLATSARSFRLLGCLRQNGTQNTR